MFFLKLIGADFPITLAGNSLVDSEKNVYDK
jgi:hypothetical protein